MRACLVFLGIAVMQFPLTAQGVPEAEFRERRARLMDTVSDGIVLLHARSGAKDEDQPTFRQDATFYYFTGLANHPDAVLALDGPRREAHLFVPPPPLSFGRPVQGLVLPTTREAAETYGLTSVRSWDGLADYLRSRMGEEVTTLYVDASRRPESTGNPPGFRPVAGAITLWQTALSEAFPSARIESARPAITAMRWVKSDAEVDILRRNARMTAAALIAGMRAVRPGIAQRDSEAAVVNGCLASGAEGPSFWPWTMSGPNAHVGRLVRAFYDYEALDRTMQAGELVRMDVGCADGHYGGDVGRTIPVSGFFSAGQREAWNLLIEGYKAGMSAMRAGVTRTEVGTAAAARIEELAPDLRTPMGRQAGDFLLSDAGRGIWSIHGVGVDSGEEALPTLEAGSVLAFEPMFAVGVDAFYLEDMILVTENGHEVLSAGLPYTAEESETLMASGGG